MVNCIFRYEISNGCACGDCDSLDYDFDDDYKILSIIQFGWMVIDSIYSLGEFRKYSQFGSRAFEWMIYIITW